MAIKDIKHKSTFYRLAMGTLNYGAANVIAKIIGFFLIPIYTMYLSPEDYGVLELCASFSVFLVIFMRLGVPGSVNRFYFDYEDDEDKLRDYITTVHRILLISSGILGVITGVIFYFYSESILPGVLFVPYIVLVLINSSLSANSDLQKRLIQSKEQSSYMAKINVANVFLGIILAILFVVVFEMGVLGLFLSQLATTVLFFFQAQYYLRNYINGKFTPSMLRDSLKYGLGLLPHHAFAAAAPLLSKGILNYKESTAALGIFSIALRFVQPLDILYGMFSKAFSPVYFSLRKEGNDESIKKIYQMVVLGASAIFSTVYILLPSLIPIMTPERFHQAADLVPILAIGFLGQVFYLLFISEIFYNKKTKYISLITGIGVVVNLVVTILLIDVLGVYAITWANGLGFIAWAVAAYLYSDKEFLRYFKANNIVLAIFVAAITVTLSIVLQKDAIVLRSAVVVCILTFFVFRFKLHKNYKAIQKS
jgi:O-antigen/teichoic acid export membrane protein